MPFKRQELVDIHLVRIYLQVCTISDILQLLLVDHSISQCGKSSPSALTGAIFHFPVKRIQRPVKED